MSTQPERILEENLIKQLQLLGHTYVAIKDETDLINNLKTQLEKHNNIKFSDREFNKVLNHLNKGNVFERAKILRDRMNLERDNGDTKYIQFINQDSWCQNEFQVCNQINNEGKYKNIYDVTLLINGLPLVQIELKRRGLELKEAFNQINRYQRHSYASNSGLFLYVQIFVISNGVNTKYYVNNKLQSLNFKQTFYWADKENNTITQLEQFAQVFLEPCNIAKMITRYVVLHEGDKILMVLRPYQYFATEAIIDRVENSVKNGYIWHTTGSGKTLTSFKTSQILTNLTQVHKVVFVVDRKDLDYQTAREFNSFSEGSIDGTENTHHLVRQFADDTKLIVTTIQKLNTAIEKERHLSKMEKLRDKKIIFIFDECHRSQFGKTHQHITKFFKNYQMFGFTGTPIFAENAVLNDFGKRTTKELFEECLHKYVIVDAIRDENVLRFSVEYVGKYKQKEGSKNNLDIEVEDIDTKELMDSPIRLNKIADYILDNHDRKTHSKEFTALFCVSNIDSLISYYELFKQKKKEGRHNLRIATIFSYGVNEDDKDANGFIPDTPLDINPDTPINKHTREKLDEFIEDYNQMYNTKYSTKEQDSFYRYYQDIGKRVKNKEVDILLVVNMFLTGFDSKPLNTLYVDKNLKYHGLIQAFSRTNRILTEQKSQGNIVCFRNLKDAADTAITLFSNKDAIETVIMQPYESYIEKFNAAYAELKRIAPTVQSVDTLVSEKEEFDFILCFRALMRLKNVLTTFADFSFDNLEMTAQEFEDYKSKYLDLFEKVKSSNAKEKVSILEDVDFELELIWRDEINVFYILQLLGKLNKSSKKDRESNLQRITDLLTNEVTLRSKRLLIEKFIIQNLPNIKDVNTIPAEFEKYVNIEKQTAINELCQDENLIPDKVNKVIENYLFTNNKPLPDAIIDTLLTPPTLLKRREIIDRITDKILKFIDAYITGIPEVEKDN